MVFLFVLFFWINSKQVLTLLTLLRRKWKPQLTLKTQKTQKVPQALAEALDTLWLGFSREDSFLTRSSDIQGDTVLVKEEPKIVVN